MSLITLTTDFGFSDPYVGAMKGVIATIAPEARILDLCHGVAPFDLLDGAYTLAQAYAFYPPGTIHVVVVDPGVGTPRRPILARVGRHLFIAPDNGVLSMVYDRETDITVRHMTARHYFLPEVSDTFHGRDIFAPAAAWVAKGVDPDNLGEPITDFIRFAVPKPRRAEDGLHGIVLKTDRFGNLITNFSRRDLPGLQAPAEIELMVGNATVATMRADFEEPAPGRLFALWGSAGYLEISAHRASAARTAGAERGAEVVLRKAAGG
ncbi:MAG: SAM hydrolase/SAM-dependent halogenase family protein [Terriglobales bacterium]